MLEINDIKYTYKNSEAPYRYTMQIQPGEITAVMGSSGSGKSTLLDLIAGFLEPQSGSILLDGHPLEQKSVKDRGMSILFQNHNLFEHLSVLKNIMLGSTNISSKRASQMLKEVGLEGYETRQASELSGGEQQRVALARVLLRKEPILLLDEPFSGLDADTHREILDLVRKITTRHRLHTIMVPHDPDDAKEIADSLYTMHQHILKKS